jgi:hypothetical protein
MFKRAGAFPSGGIKLGSVGVSGSGVGVAGGVAGGIHPQTYMRISPGKMFISGRVREWGRRGWGRGRRHTPTDIHEDKSR